MKTNMKKNKDKKIDFDDYASDYKNLMDQQTSFFEDGSEYFAEYKIRLMSEKIKNTPKKILDFGCGIGSSLQFIQSYFPDSEVYGYDVSEKSIEIAKTKNPGIKFLSINDLENYKDHFDLIFSACVFHHIPPPEREAATQSIKSLLSSGGEVFIFEHNKFNLVTQYMVSTCPFDEDAVLLRPKEFKELFFKSEISFDYVKYCLLFPKQLDFLRGLEKYVCKIPLGGQYFVHGVSAVHSQ